MQIVFHCGVHATDEGAIYETLARNRGKLAREGIDLPMPGRFRPVLRETSRELRGARPEPPVQQLIWDTILRLDDPRRVVMSFDSFLGGPPRAIGEDRFYPLAVERLRAYMAMLPAEEVEIALGLRDPASFLPAIFRLMEGDDFEAFLASTDPAALRWSELIERLADAFPEARLLVWANEDLPLIWPELIHALSGAREEAGLHGLDEFLRGLLTDEGWLRMRAFLKRHPPANVHQRRRAVAAFLERFPREDEISEELDLPGWSPALAEELSAAYDEDLLVIEAMEGVEFLTP